MTEIECHYTDPPHYHEFPDDWIFGGADGLDPRSDPRWRPTTFRYSDDHLNQLFLTQEFLCDDEAIDKFTRVARYGTPWTLEVKRPGESRFTMLPWLYDKETDSVSPPA